MGDRNQNDKSIKNYWLYVLKLEQSKYYVGVTSKTPEIRMKEHIKGFKAAKWTITYKPIQLFDKKELGYMTYAEAQKYENKVIREYMKKYGNNNARGGDLTYNGNYVIRFKRAIPEERWEVITVIVFLMVILLLVALIEMAQRN